MTLTSMLVMATAAVLIIGCDLDITIFEPPDDPCVGDAGMEANEANLYARTRATERREIVVEGSMSILDHERLASNESVTIPIHLTTLVSAWTPTEDLFMEGCAGGEVRVKVCVWVELQPDNRTVYVLPTVMLYEGEDCQTDDEEDQISMERLVGDPAESISIHVESVGSGGGDYANVSLNITNTEVPIIDEGGTCDDDRTVACISDGVSDTHCDLGSFICVRDRQLGESCDPTSSRRVCGLWLRCIDGVCAP